MKKVSVIYWSGSGNTQKMAEAVAEGAKAQGVQVSTVRVENASAADVFEANAVAMGCPSMGAEVLEEDYMEPFIAEMEKGELGGKPLALFGSYDWGDGEWMRNWQERMKVCKFDVIEEGLIARNEPGDNELQLCRELGMRLAASL